MNKLIIIGLVLASLACLANSETITVTVVEGFASTFHDYPETVTIDDGKQVIDLAREALYQFSHRVPDWDKVRLQNKLMINYDLNKTLKEAGIKDGSKVILKYWSRKDDLKANIVDRLIKDPWE